MHFLNRGQKMGHGQTPPPNSGFWNLATFSASPNRGGGCGGEVLIELITPWAQLEEDTQRDRIRKTNRKTQKHRKDKQMCLLLLPSTGNRRRGKRPRPCLARCPPACYTIFLHLARTHVQIQKGGKRTLSCGDICYRLACMLAIRSTLVSPLRNVLLRNYTHTEGGQNQISYSVLWWSMISPFLMLIRGCS